MLIDGRYNISHFLFLIWNEPPRWDPEDAKVPEAPAPKHFNSFGQFELYFKKNLHTVVANPLSIIHKVFIWSHTALIREKLVNLRFFKFEKLIFFQRTFACSEKNEFLYEWS